MTDTRTIAVLGTGIMGAPMARNLARAGFATRAWNRTRSKAEPLANNGVVVADSPAQAADGADFVLTILADADAVEASMTGAAGALAVMGSTTIWLQCSTVGIEDTQRLAQLAEKIGAPFVDAPVLGTKGPAEQGKLNVLASGPAELQDRCRLVFDAVGQKVSWLGDAGAGTRLKLVVNSWGLAVTAAISEAIALAEGLGVDPALFSETVSGTQMDSPYVHLKGEAMIKRDFPPSFPAASAAKDSRLIHEAARSCGIRDDVIAAVLEKFNRTVSEGHGGDDMAAAYLATTRK